MRIAIVGNRAGWSKERIFNILEREKVTKDDIIVSGGAEGVDSFAQEYARAKGCQIRILYPDPDLPSPKRYFDRNESVADMCDKMIAFDRSSDNGQTGTRNAINNATKLGKDVTIIES